MQKGGNSLAGEDRLSRLNFYKTTYFFLYLFIFWPKSEIFSHQKINSPPLTFDQIVT